MGEPFGSAPEKVTVALVALVAVAVTLVGADGADGGLQKATDSVPPAPTRDWGRLYPPPTNPVALDHPPTADPAEVAKAIAVESELNAISLTNAPRDAAYEGLEYFVPNPAPDQG
jgi:hypothetical protein